MREAKSRPNEPLYSRGIPFAVADKAIGPPGQKYRSSECTFWKNGERILDEDQWKMHGDTYYDGSCDQRRDADITRAAWAVVQINQNGDEVARLTGPVWEGLPQTAQAAE